MNLKYLLTIPFIISLLVFSGCNEESLLISVDDEDFLEEYFGEDFDDVSYPDTPGKFSVYFYQDDISDENLLKSTFMDDDFYWQLSFFGGLSNSDFDFDFNKIYGFSGNTQTETILLLDENKNPAYAYFKQSGSTLPFNCIFEFEPIDANQFYFRIYNYGFLSNLATLLFESIVFADQNDFYGDVTFGLKDEDFEGARIASGNDKKTFTTLLPRFHKLLNQAIGKSNGRVAANNLEQGIQQFVSDLQVFYQSNITQWLLDFYSPDGSFEESLNKLGYHGAVSGVGEQYALESMFYLSEIVSSMYLISPMYQPNALDALFQEAGKVSENQLELESMKVSHMNSLSGVPEIYDHWLYYYYDNFPELLNFYEETGLFYGHQTFGRTPSSSGNLQVSLFWNMQGADLDLKLVEPSGDTISLANPTSASGANFSQDESFELGIGREIIYWYGTAPAGEYVVLAEYAECGDGGCYSTFADAMVVNGLGDEIFLGENLTQVGDIKELGRFTVIGSTIIEVE